MDEKGQKRRELSALLAVPRELRTPVQASSIQALCAESAGGPPKLRGRRGVFLAPRLFPRECDCAALAGIAPVSSMGQQLGCGMKLDHGVLAVGHGEFTGVLTAMCSAKLFHGDLAVGYVS